MTFVAVVSAAIAIATATTNQEQTETRSTVFRLFHEVCLTSDGDISKLIDAAGRNGFAIEVGAPPRTIGRLDNAIVMPWTGDNSGTSLIVGWHGPMLSCRISSEAEVTPETLTREIESWVGFTADPRRKDGSVTNYFYTQSEGGREQLLEPEQQQSALEAGTFRVLWTSVRNQGLLLSLTAPPRGGPPVEN